jgi:predicted transcriptional regulator
MSNAVQKYYDPETGKTILYGNAEEVSVVSHEDLEQWREAKRRKEAAERGPIRYYVNCYHDKVAELNDLLDVNELGALMKLLPYLRMNTGGHLYSGKERMTTKLASKSIGKSERQATTLINRLIEVGVMSKEREGRKVVYCVNEEYHSIGRYVRDTFYTKLYQVKTRTDIAKVSIQTAGILYKMLPFFNYEHYYLCVNPEETDEMKITHMSHRQFADMVNVNRNTVNEAMKELMVHGFIMSLQSFGGQLYRINPDVMFRKRIDYGERTEFVRNQFEQARRGVEQTYVSVDIDDLPF